MKGELYKWTNYLTGWQTRWFVLKDGILWYYGSVDEMKHGCRGSFKVSALEITVSSVDSRKMYLTTPSMKILYLCAKTQEEKQLWLVALCASQGVPSCTTDTKKVPVEKAKSVRKDLQMYYDILIQEVLLIKTAVTYKTDPDIGKLTEAYKYLSESCNKFLKAMQNSLELSQLCRDSVVCVNEMCERQLENDL